MNKYTIYCTLGHTKKAFELGASLEKASSREIFNSMGFNDKSFEEMYNFKGCVIINDDVYLTPTAEQMIGWLRSKDIQFHFDDETNYWAIRDATDDLTPLRWYGYSNNKELDAIDAALEYLVNKK